MLTLYADIMGLYGEDRCKTAYQEIINRLENGGQVTGSTYKKITCRYKAKTDEVKRSPEYVDLVYRQMLSLLQLHTLHKQDLKRRGVTDPEIKELERKGYKSIEPKKAGTIAKKLLEKGFRLDGIPGFFRNRDGMWEASFYEGNRGYLCPVYSLNHKIKGFQIRVDHPVNKRKYIWFTSSGFDGGTSSGSPGRGVRLYKPGTKEHPGNRRNFKGRACQPKKQDILILESQGLETIKVCCLCLQI